MPRNRGTISSPDVHRHRHAIVTLDFPPAQDGGIARWMDQIARGLDAANRDVWVLTRGRTPENLSHDANYPTPVIRLWGHGWVRWHRMYLSAYARPLCMRQMFEGIVHAATYSVAAPLIDSVRRSGGRLFVYAHGLEMKEARAKSEKERALLERVLSQASCVLANSQNVANLAAQCGAGRVEVVRPVTNPERFSATGADLRDPWGVGDRPVILTLARLVERKGHDTVMRALPRVLKEVHDAVYVIAGKGSHREALHRLARDLGIGDSVRFVGFVAEEDLPKAYRSCDVYAMLPRESETDVEGFGITFLEAAASARAIVAGRSGGVVDAVGDEETAVLVDPTAEEALAQELIALLQDPARRNALGLAARKRVLEVASPEAMVRRLVEITET